jgi:hypothetical protein
MKHRSAPHLVCALESELTMYPKSRVGSTGLLCILLLGACGGDADPGGKPSTADATAFIGLDSAGVKIVEYAADTWPEESLWSLDPEPLLAIGVVDGDPEYELASVSGAIRLDDGTIAVADGGAGEIRFFDAEGIHIRSVGRRGGGPGEFRHLTLFDRHGADSLLVWDGILNRGSILGRDGTLARTIPKPNLPGSVSMVGVLVDGSLVGNVSAGFGRGDLPNGVVRHDAVYFRYLASGQVDTIGRLFREEGFSTPNSYYYGLPYARSAVAAATGEYLHYGSSDTYEIRTYTPVGRLVRIIRGAWASPLERRDIDRALAGMNPRSRAVFSDVSYPSTMPAYAAMKVDRAGNLWVGDYLGPGEEAQGWTIFGPAGDLLGRFMAPPRFTIHEIGADYVLGSAPDELDVDRVLVHRLIRPSAPVRGCRTFAVAALPVIAAEWVRRRCPAPGIRTRSTPPCPHC